MAPYSSESQRRKFHALEAEGKISPAVVKEFDEASKGMSLPEKVHKHKHKFAGDYLKDKK
jgi:hypothetical protein